MKNHTTSGWLTLQKRNLLYKLMGKHHKEKTQFSIILTCSNSSYRKLLIVLKLEYPIITLSKLLEKRALILYFVI